MGEKITVWLASDRATTAHRDLACRWLVKRPSWCNLPVSKDAEPDRAQPGIVLVKFYNATKRRVTVRGLKLCGTCGGASDG